MNLVRNHIYITLCITILAMGCTSPSGKNSEADVMEYTLSVLSVGAGNTKTPLQFASIRITSDALDSALHLKTNFEGNAFFSAELGEAYTVEIYHREQLFSKHSVKATKEGKATLESAQSNKMRTIQIKEEMPNGSTKALTFAHLLIEIDGIVRDSIGFGATSEKSLTITHSSDYAIRVRHNDFAEKVITIDPHATTALVAAMTREFDSYNLFAYLTFESSQTQAISGVHFEEPTTNSVAISNEFGNATLKLPVGTPWNANSITASIPGHEFVGIVGSINSGFRFYFESETRPLVDLFEYEVGTEWKLVHTYTKTRALNCPPCWYGSSSSYYRYTVISKTPDDGGFRYTVKAEQLDRYITDGDTTYTATSESIREIVENKFGYWSLIPLDGALLMPPFSGSLSSFTFNGTTSYTAGVNSGGGPGMIRRRVPAGIQEITFSVPTGFSYPGISVINHIGFARYDYHSQPSNSGSTSYTWRRF
jgi:hypothetical protein